jgi:hypothetical protein
VYSRCTSGALACSSQAAATERNFTNTAEQTGAEILYRSNLAIRDLLLANGHVIPEELRAVSGRLVEHYDRWLEEYDRIRGDRRIRLNEPFVFVGPKGYPFPSEADALFNRAYSKLREDLYGVQTSIDPSDSATRETE